MPLLGIRREDKHEWERRVPLTPDAVARLCKDPELEVVVQPSAIRVFADGDYAAAGAEVSEELAGCDVVLAVKEIPTALLRKGGAYAFFLGVLQSHIGVDAKRQELFLVVEPIFEPPPFAPGRRDQQE